MTFIKTTKGITIKDTKLTTTTLRIMPLIAECRYAERHLCCGSHCYCYAGCHLADCHYAECCSTFLHLLVPLREKSLKWPMFLNT